MLIYPDVQLLAIAHVRSVLGGSVNSRIERTIPHTRIAKVGGRDSNLSHTIAMIVYQCYAADEYSASLACRKVEQVLRDLRNTFVEGGRESGHLTFMEAVGDPTMLNDPDRPDWWRYQGSANIGARIIEIS